MFSRKTLVIAALTICVITITLFFQVGVFANQTTAGDFTVEAEAYDVFYDCNRDGKVDLMDIYGCILRFGTEGDPVRTSYLSIPPSAFQSIDETQSHYIYRQFMYGSTRFFAPVHLPHGATVTKLTAYYHDSRVDAAVHIYLIRSVPGGGWMDMASGDSGVPEASGDGVIIDDTIGYPTIDNMNYIYVVELYFDLESSQLRLGGVIIGYEYTP